MSLAVLFIERDGTLIDAPADGPVDALCKLRFVPGVFAALGELARRGYRLVMVTDQDGLGGPGLPQAAFADPQQFMIEAFRGQGIEFERILLCPRTAADGRPGRGPRTGLLEEYLAGRPADRARSAVIGSRDADLQLAASLGIRGLRIGGDPGALSWPAAVQELTARRAALVRETRETRIELRVDLDAEGPVRARTGIGFLDHMLEQLGTHGGFALDLQACGDLGVDEHHTVEDTALALGAALHQALGEKRGIARYGFLLPMDEAQARVALDLSGRPYAVFEGQFRRERIGELPTELVPHFFRSLSEGLRAAIHVSVTGENSHHMVEACFKGVGRALRQALRLEGRELPSTKGVL